MQSNFFQRSQSKVWFGSQQNSVYDNFYSLPTYYGNNNAKNPLQSITEESFSSPKNESIDERKRSFLIWGNRHSPSSQSHKSQVCKNFYLLFIHIVVFIIKSEKVLIYRVL